MSNNAVTKPEPEVRPRQEVVVQGPHPLEILQEMTRKGVPIEQIREMRSLVEWYEAREAEKAFNAAMAAFRAEVIPILKTSKVDYKAKTGGRVRYMHETLDIVLEAAVPKMSPHGLFHHWVTAQENGLITVTCVVAHRLGHSIRITLSGKPDDSGSKNSIQAVGSTVKYLERYTFMAATGLAAKGHDTDGRPNGDEADTVTGAQVSTLEKLLKETKSDTAAFLEWAEVEALDQLPESKFNSAMAMLNRKKREQQGSK